MPTSDAMRDAILDSAALVGAKLARDEEWAQAALRLGDAREMCLVLAGMLADAIRNLEPEAAEQVLADMRTMGDGRSDGWADYGME